MHATAMLDAAAALKIFSDRASAEHLKGGLVSPQNLPLGLSVLIIVMLIELGFRKFGKFRISFLFLLAFLFLLSSLYIYHQGNFRDEAAILGYGALLFQLSTAIVTTSSRRAGAARIFSTTLIVFIALSVIGFLYTFLDTESYNGHSKMDAAVVLGASVWGKDRPSPLLRGRLDRAMKLFKKGLARKIVVTGGTRRFGTVESEVEAAYLRENGISGRDIIKDRSTLSTPDQVDYVKNVLIDSLHLKKIVIVSDNWHLPRVLLMCRWQDARVKGMASGYRMFLPSEIYYRMRESAALQVYLMFGA